MSNRVAPLSGNDMSDEGAPSPPQQTSTEGTDESRPKSSQFHPDVPTPSQDSFSFKKYCCSRRSTYPKLRHQVIVVAVFGFIVQHFGIVLDDFHMAQVHNFIVGGVVSDPLLGTTFLMVVSGLSLGSRNLCISANVILFFRVKKTKWARLQRLMDKFPCPFVFWSVSHWFLYIFNVLQLSMSVFWLASPVDNPDWSCARNKTGNDSTVGPYLAIYIPAIPLRAESEGQLGYYMWIATMYIFVAILIQFQFKIIVNQYDSIVHWKGEFISDENEDHHQDHDPERGQQPEAEIIQVQPSSAIVNEKKP